MKKERVARPKFRWWAGVLALVLILSMSGCQTKPTDTSKLIDVKLATKTIDSATMAVYFKDGQLYTVSPDGGQPIRLTEALLDRADVDDEYADYFASDLGVSTFVTADGETVFYIDDGYREPDPNLQGASNLRGVLYRRSLKDPDAKPIKIGDCVEEFFVSKDGSVVSFLTYNQELYEYRNGKAEKIADGVYSLKMSKDGKWIAYNARDGLYFKKTGQEAEKIADDASMLMLSQDGSTPYYELGGTLYRHPFGGKAQLLAKDVLYPVHYIGNDTFYYFREHTWEFEVNDYIVDDMKEADKNPKEPTPPSETEPLRSDYDSVEAYNKAQEEYWEKQEAYKKAKKVYDNRDKRTEMRKQLEKPYTVKADVYALCYHDSKTETIIANSVVRDTFRQITTAPNKQIILYTEQVLHDIKLSDIASLDGIGVALEIASSHSMTYPEISTRCPSMLINGVVNRLDNQITLYYNAARALPTVSTDGKTAYFVDVVESDDYNKADIYRTEIADDRLGEQTLVVEDMYYQVSAFGKHLVSFKDVQTFRTTEPEGVYGFSDVGTMYVNGKKVADQVHMSRVTYDADSDSVFFQKDWDAENEIGTLCVYRDGKVTTICEQQYDYFDVTPEGQVLYVGDYADGSGTLYAYHDGRSIKLDEGVSRVIMQIRTGYSREVDSYTFK